MKKFIEMDPRLKKILIALHQRSMDIHTGKRNTIIPHSFQPEAQKKLRECREELRHMNIHRESNPFHSTSPQLFAFCRKKLRNMPPTSPQLPFHSIIELLKKTISEILNNPPRCESKLKETKAELLAYFYCLNLLDKFSSQFA